MRLVCMVWKPVVMEWLGLILGRITVWAFLFVSLGLLFERPGKMIDDTDDERQVGGKYEEIDVC